MIHRREFIRSAALAALALPGAGRADDLRARIVAEARRIYDQNRVVTERGTFHVPMNLFYGRFYAWDMGWQIIAQSAFDPEAAVRELEAVFAWQQDDGRVPHEALIPKKDAPHDPTVGGTYYGPDGVSWLIDPPSYLIAAEVLYHKTRDPRIIALLPNMQSVLDFLLRERDLFGDGLFAIVHAWESGTDVAPTYDKAMGIDPRDPLASLKAAKGLREQIGRNAALGWDIKKIAAADFFVIEDLNFNGIAAAGAKSVGALYDAAGEPEKADAARGIARRMTDAMEAICWDDRRGFLYPRWSVRRRELQFRSCAASFAALMSGMLDRRKADRMLDEHLLNPRRFNTRFVVPFNSAEELKREINPAYHAHLWRGPCVWSCMSWMAARAAKAYGRHEAARNITRRMAKMVAASGFREYYLPDTGIGMSAWDFTWPALVIDMIDEYGM